METIPSTAENARQYGQRLAAEAKATGQTWPRPIDATNFVRRSVRAIMASNRHTEDAVHGFAVAYFAPTAVGE